MAFTIPASITGGPQTGFTLPVYNTAVDTPPDVNAKQVAVISIGGTQAGVDAHSVARPFTVTSFRPKTFQALGKPNPVTGLISSIARNVYKVITRKGVTPLVNQPSQVALVSTEISVPAGADIADPSNIRAALSAHIGVLTAISAGLGDTGINGVM